jgi:ribonuclease HI
VLLYGGRTKEISGASAATTNNRMELTAAISALQALRRPCQVTLYTDSQYLRRGITEWLPSWRESGWRTSGGGAVENQDLWRELAEEVRRHRIEWRWVKGHAGNRLNERADALATEAREELVAPTSANRSGGKPADGEDLPRVEIYTRGCALRREDEVRGLRVGGYAAVLVRDETPETVAGAQPSATNNAMELRGVIEGLQALERRSQVIVYTPSKYVLHGATRWLSGWKRGNWRTRSGKPVKNREMWEALDRAMNAHAISWRFLSRDERGEHSEEAAQAARREAEEAIQEKARRG